MQATDIAAGGLGLLVGGLLAFALAPASPTPPPLGPVVGEAPVPTPSVDCATEAASLYDEIERLEQRHGTARLIRQAQKARRAQREGLPQPWPDDIAPALAPAAFEAAVREVAGRTDFRVLDVDCAESPCIATVEKTEGIEFTEGSSVHDLKPLLEALELEIGDFPPAYVSASYIAEEGRYVATFAPTDRDLGTIEGAKRRLHWRAERLERELEP